MDWQNASGFSPFSLVAVLVFGYLIWSLPRRRAICPILVMTGLMPMGQQLDVAGLHFYLFRILLLVGMVRVIVRGEAARLKWTRLDKVFACWVVVSVVFGTLVKPSTELLVNRLGAAYNAVGCYYVARCLVLDLDDILVSVRTLAYLSIPLAGFMIYERITQHNLLAVFGGVPYLSDIRDGHVRATGAFRHPILAGTFGGTEFPLFVGLWFYRREDWKLALIGILASLCITITANSSGALMALAGAMVGLGLWKMRSKMRLFRRATVVIVIALALVMKAPVWFLIADVSNVIGGGGWHRSYVIDTAIRHFDEWWLFGTTYTANWGPAGEVIAANPDMMDITNQYVVEGVDGGLLKLVLFVAIIVGCFKSVGRRVRLGEEEDGTRLFVWSLGVCLAAHCLSFLSITYFDQIIIVWYWLLASISGLANIPVAAGSTSASADGSPGEWEEEPMMSNKCAVAGC